MKETTSTGKNVEDAVNQALRELETEKENVEIEILDEGKKAYSVCSARNRQWSMSG